jgi:hypothetical protein
MMPFTRWRNIVEFSMPLLPTAVPIARLRTRAYVMERGLTSLVADAELLVSEFATSALTAAVRPGGQLSHSAVPEYLPTFDIILAHTGRRLLINVWDANPIPPSFTYRHYEDDDCEPRLSIVAAITQQWGYYCINRPTSERTDSQAHDVCAAVDNTRAQSQGKFVWGFLEEHDPP